jgi:hypothetical protein|eukprot:SAG25_NODE_1763_length_2377_cov_3.015364_3_plen_177_part_00
MASAAATPQPLAGQLSPVRPGPNIRHPSKPTNAVPKMGGPPAVPLVVRREVLGSGASPAAATFDQQPRSSVAHSGSTSQFLPGMWSPGCSREPTPAAILKDKQRKRRLRMCCASPTTRRGDRAVVGGPERTFSPGVPAEVRVDPRSVVRERAVAAAAAAAADRQATTATDATKPTR